MIRRWLYRRGGRERGRAFRGCASARNYGRLVSDATHIAFVDAADFVTRNMFADLYDLALYSGCRRGTS